jgi:hypothetical protein
MRSANEPVKATKFKYFFYITDKCQYRWVLDDVEQAMIMSQPNEMKKYNYGEFVNGNFIIQWQELDRLQHLTCTVY